MLDENNWKMTLDDDVLVDVGKIGAFAMLWLSCLWH